MTEQETILLSQLSKPEPEPTKAPTQEGSLLAVAAVLLHHRKPIVIATIVTTALATVVILLMPLSYVAETTILPPQQQQSSLAAFASGVTGGMAGGMGSQLGLKNPSDIYIGILKSRTVADEIINEFHLNVVYKKTLMSATRKTLSNHTRVSSSKESLISISVADHDPKQAAAIANAFVNALYRQNSRLAITDAARRRVFFEQQIAGEKDALANAELNLKQLQLSSGLMVPGVQAEALIRSGAELRAEIASRQVQLQAIRSYATDENPQVQTLKREISALENQASQMEASGIATSKLQVSGARLPGVSLEYIRSLRTLKYHETLYELLAKQYEIARIDEAKEAPLIQIVDRAVTPDRDSTHRGTLIAVAALLSLIFSSLLVLFYNPTIRLFDELGRHSRTLAGFGFSGPLAPRPLSGTTEEHPA